MITFLYSLAAISFLAATIAALPDGDLFQRQAFNANNCLRAVRAASSSGSVECSSFLRTTVVGCGGSTVTFTSSNIVTETSYGLATTTLTYVPTGPGGPQKRQASACSTSTITPSSIPGYASRCSSVAAYSFACSCQGISGSTITSSAGGTVTTTVIQTATTTTTSVFGTVTQYPSTNYFYIVLPGGRRVVGRYDAPDTVLATSADQSQYAVFFLNQNAELQFYPSNKYNLPKVGVREITGKNKLVSLSTYPSEAGTRLTCTLSNPSGGGGALVCTAGGLLNYPVLCGDVLYYSAYRDQAGCAAVDLFAVRAG